MTHLSKLLLTFLTLIIVFAPSKSQTVGLIDRNPGLTDGYTLFRSLGTTSLFLVDNCGRSVHEWESPYTPGNSEYLLENGILVRTVKSGGVVNPIIDGRGGGERVQFVTWEGTVIWDYVYNAPTYRMHHDIAVMPNAHILILAWDLRTYQESVAAGRDLSILPDSVIWSEKIIEVNPFTNQIVWEWNLWDHLIQDYDSTKQNYGIIADHPELLDINAIGIDGPGADWIHANSIDYNPELDQIVMNSRSLSEFYVIDHSTTTAEAAQHTGGNSNMGGDLLYRWGNPQIYNQGSVADQQMFGGHDVNWIEPGFPDAGKFLLFNNGLGRTAGAYSSVEIIDPPLDSLTETYLYMPGTAYAPANQDWIYTSDTLADFYSFFISGAQRLENGNTLVCEGSKGRIFELDSNDDVVWEYVNPIGNAGPLSQASPIPINGGFNVNATFRATKYPADYPGFAGRDLTSGAPLEFDYIHPYICDGDTLLTCNAPSNINATNITTQSVQLSWDTVPGAWGYELTGGLDGLTPLEPIGVGTQTTISINGLEPGASYYWRVRAVCNSGGTAFSPYSSNGFFATLPLCGQVTNLSTTNITATGATLNWQLTAGAVGYQITGRATGGPIVSLNINNGSQSMFVVNGLIPNITYLWTIRSFCPNAGFSEYAAPISFATLPTASEKQKAIQASASGADGRILLYPNPTSRALYVTLEYLPEVQKEINMYDVTGALVLQSHLNKEEKQAALDVTNLTPGIYVVNVKSSGVSYHSMVIVQ